MWNNNIIISSGLSPKSVFCPEIIRYFIFYFSFFSVRLIYIFTLVILFTNKKYSRKKFTLEIYRFFTNELS